mmetsp:Transcript_103952/g.294025  ORF Transcript_103952/g.294025 Transcript_103952/m.294025 type:complete len:213 (+) Transcript_103952:394-1032(+)
MRSRPPVCHRHAGVRPPRSGAARRPCPPAPHWVWHRGLRAHSCRGSRAPSRPRLRPRRGSRTWPRPRGCARATRLPPRGVRPRPSGTGPSSGALGPCPRAQAGVHSWGPPSTERAAMCRCRSGRGCRTAGGCPCSACSSRSSWPCNMAAPRRRPTTGRCCGTARGCRNPCSRARWPPCAPRARRTACPRWSGGRTAETSRTRCSGPARRPSG